jgi:transposase
MVNALRVCADYQPKFGKKRWRNDNDLPCEMNCGSGSRCRRRLAEWQKAGVWVRLHALLLTELQGTDKIDWSRASVDSSFARALGGGAETGPNPSDRGKKGAVSPSHGYSAVLSGSPVS